MLKGLSFSCPLRFFVVNFKFARNKGDPTLYRCGYRYGTVILYLWPRVFSFFRFFVWRWECVESWKSFAFNGSESWWHTVQRPSSHFVSIKTESWVHPTKGENAVLVQRYASTTCKETKWSSTSTISTLLLQFCSHFYNRDTQRTFNWQLWGERQNVTSS